MAERTLPTTQLINCNGIAQKRPVIAYIPFNWYTQHGALHAHNTHTPNCVELCAWIVIAKLNRVERDNCFIIYIINSAVVRHSASTINSLFYLDSMILHWKCACEVVIAPLVALRCFRFERRGTVQHISLRIYTKYRNFHLQALNLGRWHGTRFRCWPFVVMEIVRSIVRANPSSIRKRIEANNPYFRNNFLVVESPIDRSNCSAWCSRLPDRHHLRTYASRSNITLPFRSIIGCTVLLIDSHVPVTEDFDSRKSSALAVESTLWLQLRPFASKAHLSDKTVHYFLPLLYVLLFPVCWFHKHVMFGVERPTTTGTKSIRMAQTVHSYDHVCMCARAILEYVRISMDPVHLRRQ